MPLRCDSYYYSFIRWQSPLRWLIETYANVLCCHASREQYTLLSIHTGTFLKPKADVEVQPVVAGKKWFTEQKIHLRKRTFHGNSQVVRLLQFGFPTFRQYPTKPVFGAYHSPRHVGIDQFWSGWLAYRKGHRHLWLCTLMMILKWCRYDISIDLSKAFRLVSLIFSCINWLADTKPSVLMLAGMCVCQLHTYTEFVQAKVLSFSHQHSRHIDLLLCTLRPIPCRWADKQMRLSFY